jgi:hypothetical protein
LNDHIQVQVREPDVVAQRLQQLALLDHYRGIAAAGGSLPSIEDVGFRVFSQNDEDGLLLFVFALAGFESRMAVEISASDGIECNSANLIVNHGFVGLLFDSDDALLERGRAFYRRRLSAPALQPRLVQGWITRDNVNALVREHMFPGERLAAGEIDLLSLDLDGNDWWVLQALELRPRVIVLEFNAALGAERALTIPYDPGFRARLEPIPYMGASLPAFVSLLRPRGYRLVGVERLGFNAVFVRNDLAKGLPERSAAECLDGPTVRILQAGLRADPRLTHELMRRPWVEV